MNGLRKGKLAKSKHSKYFSKKIGGMSGFIEKAKETKAKGKAEQTAEANGKAEETKANGNKAGEQTAKAEETKANGNKAGEQTAEANGKAEETKANGNKAGEQTAEEKQKEEDKCQLKIKTSREHEITAEQERIEKSIETDLLKNLLARMPFPFNYIVNPTLKAAVQSAQNYMRIRDTFKNSIINEESIKKSHYEEEYGALDAAAKDEVKYACKLIKLFYDKKISIPPSILSIEGDTHTSCSLTRSLNTQNRLYTSVREDGYKEHLDKGDFAHIFNGENNFKGCYELISTTIPDSMSVALEEFAQECVEKLFEYDDLKPKQTAEETTGTQNGGAIGMKPMNKLAGTPGMNKGANGVNATQQNSTNSEESIDNKNKKKCGYLILFLLADIYRDNMGQKINYINDCELADIKCITNEDSCDSLYAFVDMATMTGLSQPIGSAIGILPEKDFKEAIIEMIEKSKGKDDAGSGSPTGVLVSKIHPSKKTPENLAKALADPGYLKILSGGSGKEPAAQPQDVNRVKGALTGLMGGKRVSRKHYRRSKRALPKKRRLTMRRVKVIK
jgi:hypothetical protein